MAIDDTKIIFRRIRGRIVPIKVSKLKVHKRKQLIAESVGLTSAGIFSGIIGGTVTGALATRGGLERLASFRLPGEGGRAKLHKSGISPQMGLFARGIGRQKLAKTFGASSRIFSAALIGLGIEKGIKATGIRIEGIPTEAAAEITGVAGAFAFERALSRQAKRTSLSIKLSDPATQLPLFPKQASKIKTALRAIIKKKFKF